MRVRGSRARGRRRERGAVAVEFALLLPILLLIVFGIIQYGMYFWAMQGGSDIARDAARLSAVGNPATCPAFQGAVRSEVESLTGTGSTASITRSYSPGPPATVVGSIVTVRLEFRSLDLKLPFLPFVNDGMVTSTAQSRVEFVPQQPQSCTT